MAKNIKSIADRLGAKIVGQVPDTGGGAFGAARLAKCVEHLQGRLVPGQGKRRRPPQRCQLGTPPENPHERRHPAAPPPPGRAASASGRKVSPMQIAAQILEDALAGVPDQ